MEDPAARAAWHVEEFEDAEPPPHTGPIPFNPNSGAAAGNEETAYEWIRLDPEMMWVARTELKQSGVMWASQLARERDVGAQMEAIWAFGGGGEGLGPAAGTGLCGGLAYGTGSLTVGANGPGSTSSGAVSTALCQTVLVPAYFFRVRCAAARALASQGAPGLFHLLKIWTKWCYEPDSNNGNGGDGFAQSERHGAWLGGALVRGTIVDQLVYNDNNGNTYADDMYIATLITALGTALIPPDVSERNELAHNHTVEMEMEEAMRRQMEEDENAEVLSARRDAGGKIPSSRSALVLDDYDEWASKQRPAIVLGLFSVRWLHFVDLCGINSGCTDREANAIGLRTAAMDALLLMKWWRTKALIQYILQWSLMISREVRRHVARSIVTSWPFSMQLRCQARWRDEPLLVVEDDSGAPRTRSKKAKGICCDPSVDHEVRWCMLKLADLIYRPAEEPHVKIKIHIPPTPISEAPPAPLPVVTPAPLLNLSGTLPKLKLHSPRTSAGPLPPLVPPVAPSPLAFESTPERMEYHFPNRSPSARSQHPSLRPNQWFDHVPLLQPKVITRLSPEQASIPLPRPKKVKPAAPVHQGMNKTTHAHCKAVLNALHRNPHAAVFRLPVDPVRDNAPNYFTVIKHPMDLSTMKAKLDNKIYKDRAEFEEDFKLMIQNAKIYNAPLSFVFNEAIALEKAFNDRWTKIDASASAAQALEMEISGPIASSSKPSKPIPSPLETPTRVKVKPKMFPGWILHPAKSKEPAPPPVTPSPVDQKSKTPKIKLITRPKTSTYPSTSGFPSSSPSPCPGPIATSTTASPTSRPLLAIETESEMKKGKKGSYPSPCSYAPSTKANSKPIVFWASEEHENRQNYLQDPRASTPSGASTEKKSPFNSVRGYTFRSKRTPAVTTKVRVIKGPEGSSKPAVSVTQKRKDPGPHVHREKPAPSDPFLSPLGAGPKGKAKDAAPPAPPRQTAAPPTPAPPAPSPAASSSQRIDVKRCERILASLRRAENAFIFERPVDPIKDGCPTTMSTKLRNGKYRTMNDFKLDVELIVSNCRAFNPPGTFPVLAAEALEAVFKREWSKINTEPRRISSGDRRALVSMCVWFLVPVDPIQQNVPDYHDIIPKRDARDLSLIKSNIESGKYDSLDALTADVYLMQANAVKFNGEYSNVAADARTFVTSFENALAAFKRKRKGPEVHGSSSGTKKQKLY
ncbi:Peptidase family M1 domain [Rhizoctonia solani]|uniref:Peptidase family M1 domain n=1 Tax=Rhizoctonia solani TaxID=456999 RepID=A0A8H7M3J7_9AGAM|nr:Peptidase family M1 domain [Rhizoctonia solani]